MCIFSPQGKFQGLDLNEELHVGGYPNYTVLAKTAGIKTGFVGKTLLDLHQRRGESLLCVKFWFGIPTMQAASVSWSSKARK